MSYFREMRHLQRWFRKAPIQEPQQRRRSLVWPLVILVFIAAVSATQLRADTISGSIKDPSGAFVTAARIEIIGNNLPQRITLVSDGAGRFVAPNLAPGSYNIRVLKEGFSELVKPVEVHGNAEISLTLSISAQQSSITVTDKNAAFANSDPFYRQLRDAQLTNSFHCETFKFPMDVGTFELQSGTITLLALVDKFETGVVFTGRGHFTMKPVAALDASELSRRAGAAVVEEDFSEVVFRFSPEEFSVFTPALGAATPVPPEAVAAFQHWKEKLRHRNEVPQGLTEDLLQSETIDNVDADVLAAVYNPKHPAFFNSYMHGSPHKDLRFFLRIRTGAIPQLDSPEEVALINANGDGSDDGIWYSQHLVSELKAHTASSLEERRLFATRGYTIETVIAKNEHLFSHASIKFEPLLAGERVMKFGLLPNLRVLRVTGQDGKDLHFVQEDRKQDGSFYVILDEAPAMGQTHSISVDYGGDKVLFNAGNGSYYVGARDSWYPNLNGFGEKALYDLTFKVPPPNTVISVGNLVDQRAEAGFAVTHWTTPVPIAVAGFNYGQYKKMDMADGITHYNITGYYLTELPDALHAYQGNASQVGNGDLRGMALNSLAPGSMTKYALEQTRAQMQVCTFYFGRAPYENIYITEQPNFNFGQSWPNLVYLPISAYIDSTQRWMMFGQIDTRFTGFVQEVTPHEVAHQWFGHSVGWASYHDQWLSEGFAEFAAALFLQQAMGPKWQKDYIDFWDRQHRSVLDKNNFGISPNDAGPLWLGIRLVSPHTARAYQGVTYAKGAYVLSMLRSLMRSDAGGTGDPDQAFIDMMHDFMETHRNTPASTESFEAVVNKHLPAQLDLQKNGRMDWFFREWIMGTEIPRYSFKYQTESAEGGKIRVKAEISQSEVDQNFAMFVPVYGDFGNGMVRLAQVPIVGNSTRSVSFLLDRAPKKVVLNAYKDILER